MSRTGKRALAYSGALVILVLAVHYGHDQDRSGIAVVAAVLMALVVFEATVRSHHR